MLQGCSSMSGSGGFEFNFDQLESTEFVS